MERNQAHWSFRGAKSLGKNGRKTTGHWTSNNRDKKITLYLGKGSWKAGSLRKNERVSMVKPMCLNLALLNDNICCVKNNLDPD